MECSSSASNSTTLEMTRFQMQIVSGVEKKGGGGENGLQLSRSLSNQQRWCQMELSNYSYFPAEIAREAQKAAQRWGDSHVSGSCSPGNRSLALWLLSVEGIRVQQLQADLTKSSDRYSVYRTAEGKTGFWLFKQYTLEVTKRYCFHIYLKLLIHKYCDIHTVSLWNSI